MANELKYQLKSKTDQLNFIQEEAEDVIRKTANERENVQLELEGIDEGDRGQPVSGPPIACAP